MTPRRLKAWRDMMGLSQEAFGDWLGGYSRVTVNRWERGLQPIPKMAGKLLELHNNQRV